MNIQYSGCPKKRKFMYSKTRNAEKDNKIRKTDLNDLMHKIIVLVKFDRNGVSSTKIDYL